MHAQGVHDHQKLHGAYSETSTPSVKAPGHSHHPQQITPKQLHSCRATALVLAMACFGTCLDRRGIYVFRMCAIHGWDPIAGQNPTYPLRFCTPSGKTNSTLCGDYPFFRRASSRSFFTSRDTKHTCSFTDSISSVSSCVESTLDVHFPAQLHI